VKADRVSYTLEEDKRRGYPWCVIMPVPGDEVVASVNVVTKELALQTKKHGKMVGCTIHLPTLQDEVLALLR
jgi:hypothetical protein